MRKLTVILIMILAFVSACHAQQWGTLPGGADVVVLGNYGTTGTTLSGTTANNMLVSSQCTIGTSCTFTGGPGFTSTAFTIGAYQNASSNLGPVQMNGSGGTLYPAQSMNYNNMAYNDTNNQNAWLNFSGTPGSSHQVSVLVQMNVGWSGLGNGDDMDVLGIWNTSSDGQYFEGQLNSDCGVTNAFGARIETGHTTQHSPGCIPFAPSVVSGLQGTIYMALSADTQSQCSTLTLLTPGGSILGIPQTQCSSDGSTGSGTLKAIQIGNNENGSNSGTTYYQNLLVNYSSAGFVGGNAATVINGNSTVTGITGCSASWSGYAIILPDTGSAGSGANNIVAYCNSSTSLTLTANYSGTTVSGSATWQFQPPLFWPNNALAAGVLSPGRFTAWAPGASVILSRAQCTTTACNTVVSNGSASTATQINAAIASALTNQYVSLPAGTYSSLAGCIKLSTSNVSLRGAGAQSSGGTILNLTSTSGCNGAGVLVGNTANSAGSPQNGPVAVTGSTVQGSQLVTLASVPNLVIGNNMVLDQLDPTADNGGIFVSGTGSSYTPAGTSPGLSGAYSSAGGGNGIRGGSGCSSSPSACYHQQQIVTVTSCNGVTTVGTACTGTNVAVGFYPGLHAPNWTANIFAWWGSSTVLSAGLEEMQLNSAGNSGANGVQIENCDGCWVKGIASLDTSQAHIIVDASNLCTVRDSYFFLTQAASTGSYGVDMDSASDCLIENNIFHAVTTPMINNGSSTGTVWGYNYCVNMYYTGSANYSIPCIGGHSGGDDTNLAEGNIGDGITGDNIHGTANLWTFYRNYFSQQQKCWQSGSPYGSVTWGACNSGTTTIQDYAFHRFYSLIANVLGTTGDQTTYCNGSTSCAGNYTANNTNVLGIGYGNTVANDVNTQTTAMLWGNADPVTGFASPRFNCSEVPTFPASGTATASMYLVQLPYLNPCPQTHTLPASFYHSSKPSWWPSAKPWPIIGPDVTGGNVSGVNGLVYTNPAEDCYLGLGGSSDGTGGQLTGFNDMNCYYDVSVASPTSLFNGAYNGVVF